MQETPEVTWFSTIMLMGGALGIASNVYKFVMQPLERYFQRLRRKFKNSERQKIITDVSDTRRRFEELQNQEYVFTNSPQQQLIEASQSEQP